MSDQIIDLPAKRLTAGVTKTTRECYEVRDGMRGGEWANIMLNCWSRPVSSGEGRTDTYYCGEITIQSSHGTWGYIWTACAIPFKEFLCGVGFDYAFGKFMGSDLKQFDGEGSMHCLRRQLLEGRLHTELSKEEARALWNALKDREDEVTSSLNDWVNTLTDIADNLWEDQHKAAVKMLDEPWELAQTQPKPCAVNFWRDLWPLFVDALKAEMGVARSSSSSVCPEPCL